MKMLTVREVMERLGFSEPDVVYALIRSGQLRAYAHRVNGKGGRPTWRISEDALAEYLASVETGAAAPQKQNPPVRAGGELRRLLVG